MTNVIGIDLGTTNSCVCVMEAGKPVVIPNSEGARTTPSMVGFSASGERLVGQIAKRQAVTNSERTVFGVKRLIGRKYQDQLVQETQPHLPFKILGAENGDAWVKIGETQHSPAEISSIVLKKMKEIAEDYLGQAVSDAVITVPAYFDDAQRQATKDAGRIAGLNVLRIINEPTAAALAYGIENDQSEKIAVFDLGGGTFDISILELNAGVYEVKSTNGDTFLGGEDFDLKLLAKLVEDFKSAEGIDLSQDPLALQRIKEAAEKAKCELSSVEETRIELPFIASKGSEPRHLKVTLKRADLENLTQELIDRLSGPCQKALEDAQLASAQISKILLVGGMTRMPAIRRKVREIFGKEGDASLNPDEVVAIGASVQGAILRGEVSEVVLLDVTPLSLGIETAGKVFTKIIERNTTIPTKKSKIFTTAEDNQSFVNVHVLQGEREIVDYNKTLAKFELTDIPPAPRAVPQIEVTFSIDSNGIVSVKAKDLGTGKEQAIKVRSSSGLSENEIKDIIQDAQTHAAQDAEAKTLATSRIELESLVFSSEKSVNEFQNTLTSEMVDKVSKALANAKKLLEAESTLEQIQNAKTELTDAAHSMAEEIYGQVAQSSD